MTCRFSLTCIDLPQSLPPLTFPLRKRFYAPSSKSLVMSSTVNRTQNANLEDCLRKMQAEIVSAASKGKEKMNAKALDGFHGPKRHQN
jgi:hypothetical protein